MPSSIHDSGVRTQLEQRLRQLRTDTKPHWGKMSVDQMLWHVNQSMSSALDGGDAAAPSRRPLPAPVLKFLVLKMPWMKSAPTMPALVATARHDFETERARCLDLMGRLSARSLEGAWPLHPMMGRMTGPEVSRLHAKHLDHHFKQFGV